MDVYNLHGSVITDQQSGISENLFIDHCSLVIERSAVSWCLRGENRVLSIDHWSLVMERSADAFGIKIAGAGSTPNQILYSGEYLDLGTGNYGLRARVYDENTGTFLTRDTYAGQNGDPITLRQYLYAGADPVMFADPSGREFTIPSVTISIGINFGLTFAFDVAGDTFGAKKGIGEIIAESAVGGLLGVIGGPLAGEFADTVLPKLVEFLPDAGRMEKFAQLVLRGFSLGIFRSVYNTTALYIVYFFEHPGHPLTVGQTTGLFFSSFVTTGALGALESSSFGPEIQAALAKIGANPTGALGALECLGVALPKALANVNISGVAGDALLAFVDEFVKFLSEQAAIGH